MAVYDVRFFLTENLYQLKKAFQILPGGDGAFTTDTIDAGGIPAAMDKGCPEADYIFTKSKITSPFNLLYVLGGKTEVIVTFPTRLACHNTPSDTMFNAYQDEITGKWGFYTIYNETIRDDKEHILDLTDFGYGPNTILPFAANTIKLSEAPYGIQLLLYLEVSSLILGG